jgi:hypothetical protein
VLVISEITAVTTKQTVTEEGGTNDDDDLKDENCHHPALGCQERVPKKQKN